MKCTKQQEELARKWVGRFCTLIVVLFLVWLATFAPVLILGVVGFFGMVIFLSFLGSWLSGEINFCEGED